MELNEQKIIALLDQINKTILDLQSKNNINQWRDSIYHRLDDIEKFVNTNSQIDLNVWKTRCEGEIKSISEKISMIVQEQSYIQSRIKEHKNIFEKRIQEMIVDINKIKSDSNTDIKVSEVKWMVNKENWTLIKTIGVSVFLYILYQFIIFYFK